MRPVELHFRDHGVVRRTIDEGYEDAERALRDLADVGISIDEITDDLQADGVKLFSESFRKIGETVARKARELQVSAA